MDRIKEFVEIELIKKKIFALNLTEEKYNKLIGGPIRQEIKKRIRT